MISLKASLVIVFLSMGAASGMPKYKQTAGCPQNLLTWEMRELKFSCTDIVKEYRYHCLLNTEDKAYELCMRRIPIPPETVGCPQISHIESGNPQLTIPFSECWPMLQGCPPRNHQIYYTNELYKYPLCLLPTNKRNQSSYVTTEYEDHSTTTSTVTYGRGDSHIYPGYIVAISLASAVIFFSILGILYCWKRRGQDSCVAVEVCSRSLPSFCVRFQNTPNPEPEELIPFETSQSDINETVAHGNVSRDNLNHSDGTPSKSYLHIIVVKRMLWTYLKNLSRKESEIKNESKKDSGEKNELKKESGTKTKSNKESEVKYLKEFFDMTDNKHALYGQWKNYFCCYCKKMPDTFKKQFISDIGWKTLFEKDNSRHCEKDLIDCPCLYDAIEVEEEKVSIATLLSVTFAVGKLSKNGKRSLGVIRFYCESVLGNDNSERKKSDKDCDEISKMIKNFVMCSSDILHWEVTSDLLSLLQKYTEAELDESEAEECKQHRETDENDLSPLKVIKVGKDTLATMQERTKSFIEEETFYVEVKRQVEEAKKHLNEHHLLIVTGQAGEGKSSLCRHLLKEDDSTYKLKLRSEQEGFDFMIGTGETFCLYFEDFLGMNQHLKLYSKDNRSFYQCLLETSNWKYTEKKKKIISPKYSELKIICCVRKSVFQEACTDKEIEKLAKFTFDISSPPLKLKKRDLQRVLRNYRKKYPNILKKKEGLVIIEKYRKDDFYGFHECCALCFKSNLGLSVFFHPEKTLRDQVRCLKGETSCTNIEYIVLLYILLANEPYSTKSLNYDLLKQLLSLHGLPTHLIPSIDGSNLLTTNTQGKLEFQHQFVREAVLGVFGEEHADKLMQYAVEKVVIEYARPSTYTSAREDEVYLRLKEESDRELAKKLLHIHSYQNIAVNKSVRDEKFVNEHLIVAIKERITTHCRDKSQGEKKTFTKTVIAQIKQGAENEKQLVLQNCLEKHFPG